MIAMGIGRFAYTPILPLMQNSLQFTDSMAGYLASVNYGGYFVGAILVSILPIHHHKTAFLRGSLFASIVTTCIMGLTHVYPIMFIVRFISGVASAFIFVAASSIVLDKLAHSGKTNWAGYFYSGVGFGIFFSTLFIPSLNAYFQWEGVWIGLAIISSILAIFVWLWLRDTPVTEGLAKCKEQVLAIRTPPLKWLPWLVLAYGLEGLGYIITGTFIVAIAEQSSAISFEPSIVWVVVGFAAIPSCILWSTLAKKWGLVKSLVIAMSLQAVGIALPVFSLTEASFITSALLFGGTFMGITTLATTLGRLMKPMNSSRIIGFLTAIYAFGQMIGPSLAGIMLTHTNNFQYILLGAAIVVFLGAMALVGGIRYEGENNQVESSTTTVNE